VVFFLDNRGAIKNADEDNTDPRTEREPAEATEQISAWFSVNGQTRQTPPYALRPIEPALQVAAGRTGQTSQNGDKQEGTEQDKDRSSVNVRNI